MNNNVTFTDKRLLEALDYIDESFIAEVTEDYKVYPTADEYIGDKKPHSKILRSLKYVAAVAACALLMSTLIPVVQYVSGNLGDLFAGMFGPPSDTSELTEDSYKIPEEHIENAPYFIFSPDLEPISAEPDSKKGYVIVYRCTRCGELHRNRAALKDGEQKDDISLIIKLTACGRPAPKKRQ